MKVYKELLKKGIYTQKEFSRAMRSIAHIKNPYEKEEAEWECILNWAANHKFI